MENDKKHKKILEHNQKNRRDETQINLPPPVLLTCIMEVNKKKTYVKPHLMVYPLCDNIAFLAATRHDNVIESEVEDADNGGEVA